MFAELGFVDPSYFAPSEEERKRGMIIVQRSFTWDLRSKELRLS